MTVNIQNASNVTVVGTHDHKNCKGVYCITTGEVYASVMDAAKANNMTQGAMSAAIAHGSVCRNGNKFCFVSRIIEHLDEIAVNNRARTMKVNAYDEVMARREVIRKAEDKLAKHRAKVEELRQMLNDEMELMADADIELQKLQKQDAALA